MSSVTPSCAGSSSRGRATTSASGRTSWRYPSTPSRSAERPRVGVLGLVRMVPAAIALAVRRHAGRPVSPAASPARDLRHAGARPVRNGRGSGRRRLARAGLYVGRARRRRQARRSARPPCRSCHCSRALRRELVATNVSSSTLEGVGTLVGPAIGGVLAASAGVAIAVAAGAVVNVVCALLVMGIRRAGDVTGARRRVERNLRQELLGGVHTLAREPHPRLIVLLFNSQTMVRGLLNVLLVVASIELLGLGEAGVGWLNAALGAGGLARRARGSERSSPGAGSPGSSALRSCSGVRRSPSSASGREPAGHSCASASWESATRCSTSRASRCSSGRSTSICSGESSVSSRSESPWRRPSARCSARSWSTSWGSAWRSSVSGGILPALALLSLHGLRRDRRVLRGARA